MKGTLLTIILLSSLTSFTQVQFFEGTLSEALGKATASGKMVFVHFESATCGQCNDVADKAFESAELAKAIDQKCIALKMQVNAPDREFFIDKYNPDETIGSFYLRNDGDLVYRTTSTSSFDKKYITDITTAWNRLTEGRIALKELDAMWLNEQSVAAMEANLLRRSELMLPLDSLLDIYASTLPADSFRSVRIIQFISRMAPAINSSAYRLSRKDSLFKRAWYGIPLKERIGINHRIISKSMAKAIESKNMQLASQTTNFVWAVNSDTKDENRRRKYEYTWIRYLKGSGDTANYLRRATAYYNHYYLTISVDSIHLQDSLITAQRVATTKPDSVFRADNKRIETRTIQQSNIAQQYANYLANAARDIYLYDKNGQYTQLVLSYAKRAVDFYETQFAADIYAKLLYKHGDKQEAIAMEEKIIAFLQKHQLKSHRYESVLVKMKAGEKVEL
jgi:hypothetical protein